MTSYLVETTMELRITAKSIVAAKEKLESLLEPAGLMPSRMRCDGKQLTAEGEFAFVFSGRVKPIVSDGE